MSAKQDIYGGRDPRDVPLYSVADAAWYLGIPSATLRSWCSGRPYPTKRGSRHFPAVLELPKPGRLSFMNLVEAHVLDAIRRTHKLSLKQVRTAVKWLGSEGVDHPLAQKQFMHDKSELFVEHLGEIYAADGQEPIRDAIERHLSRIEVDAKGFAVRLFPFARTKMESKVVVIDPRISFGRPTLAGTGVPVDVIVERFRAGESITELVDDYGCESVAVGEAIRLATRPAASAA